MTTPDLVERLRVLSLFAGIGGFDLGLERTGGFETVAFCEIDPYRRSILSKHWPDVRQYEDVRNLTADALARDGIVIDVICGGFPCQDISIAGKGRGLAGAKSRLWFEFLRIIGEIRPTYALIENSPKLRSRGLDVLLGGLSEIGYDAEWHCIPAAHVGAPHRRDRIWILAYRQEDAFRADADSFGPYPPYLHFNRSAQLLDQQERDFGPMAWWRTEPDVARVVDGIPSRLDIARIRATGDSVVPFIPELIGRAILEARSAA
ncbi:DNA (cytosine-5-)-methyltransferase [Hoeflea sp. 108]|jgi:DNA (cytosine-5)-methyltransferase 1|uniref:DNA cytosine methyltransferase n=1 Tax=Hoeflea sp. 108 TaxID=1116369 RepID=UPI000364E61D|nr:DNA (cytosine-5-)-methyltransferase [Hoeflea sp. 108]